MLPYLRPSEVTDASIPSLGTHLFPGGYSIDPSRVRPDPIVRMADY